MKTVRAFSPGHVTGLFYIPEIDGPPVAVSSMGAGFSTSLGVVTEVVYQEAPESSTVISINNDEIADNAVVSRKVLELFFRRTGIAQEGRLRIDHMIDIPQGSGFGSSGAGALSLSLALNSLYGTGLSTIEAGQIAHIAEIECRTGLGTVMGELTGGMKVLIKPGGPGIGKVQTISYPENTRVLFLVFNPVSTAGALTNPSVRTTINSTGLSLHRELLKDTTFTNYKHCSREFSMRTGFASKTIREVLARLDKSDIPGSMLFFGDALVSLTGESDYHTVRNIFSGYTGKGRIIECGIEPGGARIV